VTVTASVTGVGSTSQTFLWQTPKVGILNTIPDQTGNEGNSVTALTISTNLSSPTFNVSGLPAGLSISSGGVISGTIAAGASYNNTVDVGVTDGTNASCTSFAWTVNPAVSFTAVPDQTSTEGDAFSLAVTATDSQSGTLTYSADGLPPNLTISSTTGAITGTLASGSAGEYGVILIASDGTYQGTWDFNFRVHHSSTIAPPTLTNPGTQTNLPGDTVNLQLSFADTDNAPLTFTATGLPDGLSVDSSESVSTTGLISGTLDAGSYSSAAYSVTVTAADDSGNTASQTFNWYVEDGPLTGTGVNVSATAGTDTGLINVATFSTANVNVAADTLSANITWGDGKMDVGTIQGGSGSFTVTDDHTYATPGTYTVAVQIAGVDGSQVGTASSTATVTPAPLTATGGMSPIVDFNYPNTVQLGTFTDPNLDLSPADFSVSVTWASGVTTSGSVTSTAHGIYDVWGTHNYHQKDVSPTASWTVTGPSGESSSATATINEIENLPPLTATAENLATDPGVALVNVGVATFSISRSTAVPADFTATVDWGDSPTPSTGTIVALGNSVFEVEASKTYAVGGPYAIKVGISDAEGLQVNVQAQAQVGAPIALTAVQFGGGEQVIARDRVSLWQWSDRLHNGSLNGGWSDPYAYWTNQALKVTKAVFVAPAGFTKNLDIEGTFYGFGADGKLVQIALPPQLNTAPVGNMYSYSGTATQAFSAVNSFERARIVWQARLSGTAEWTNAGMDWNNIYVAFDKPPPNFALFETPLAYGCNAASNAPDDIFNAIWKNFEGKTAARLDGTPLTYYKTWNTRNISVGQLLKTGDGQCGAFQKLMLAAIASQGLDDILSVTGATLVAKNQQNEGFLVGDWVYFPPTNGTAAYPWVNSFSGGTPHFYDKVNRTWKYKWTGPALYVSSDGQNNPRPAADFVNHVVVKATVAGKTQYYDPSYGTAYDVTSPQGFLAKFQADSIKGYYNAKQTPGKYLIREPSNQVDIEFK